MKPQNSNYHDDRCTCLACNISSEEDQQFVQELEQKEQSKTMKDLQKLREALEQQRKYERENWPFEGGTTGESITYHLASLYCWSPQYVLSLPPEQRDQRLNEIWRSFSIAGDIIKRYETATEAILE